VGQLHQRCPEIYLETLVARDKRQFYDYVVMELNGEGVMIKDLNGFYYPGERRIWKVKKTLMRDYHILGFTPGKGKYSSVIGAIIYGIKLPDGTTQVVGKASGMTDAERIEFAKSPEAFIGKLAEFEGQEEGKGGALRHPRFRRLRDDLS
jgi:ATP-dependent DNA ligase